MAASRYKNHTCDVPKGFECVAGSLYDEDSFRVARPVCPCGCHLPPGTKKERGK
jgi:hypothetical protein